MNGQGDERLVWCTVDELCVGDELHVGLGAGDGYKGGAIKMV